MYWRNCFSQWHLFEGFCVKLNSGTWTCDGGWFSPKGARFNVVNTQNVILNEINFPMIYNMPCNFFDTNIAPDSWTNTFFCDSNLFFVLKKWSQFVLIFTCLRGKFGINLPSLLFWNFEINMILKFQKMSELNFPKFHK